LKKYLYPADILLPDFNKTDGTRWSCIACDQYTSEPEYWEAVAHEVGDAPSTLRLILPEVYLDESDGRTAGIQHEMREYLKGLLISHPESMIYLERRLRDGKLRRGIIGAIDLCDYDFTRGSSSLIRATEETVPERIPPRVQIRRGAALELPHVMLLIDDADGNVMSIAREAVNSTPVYDHDLMQNSGHVTGYLLSQKQISDINEALSRLASADEMAEKYGRGDIAPLLFAVGDGNHSLATAKACFDELKAKLGEDAAMSHPARYALVELVDLYDESLEFEPIYRVLFGVDVQKTVAAFESYAAAQNGKAKPQNVTLTFGNEQKTVTIPHPTSNLAVGSVQDFVAAYLNENPSAAVDYIHGEDTAIALSSGDGAVGFIFDGMSKGELFATVIADGALPRKTFSMGHACDKRFYTEARRILRD